MENIPTKGLKKIQIQMWNLIWTMLVYWRAVTRVVQFIVPITRPVCCCQPLPSASSSPRTLPFAAPIRDRETALRTLARGTHQHIHTHTHRRNCNAMADTHHHFRARTFTRAVASSIECPCLCKRTICGVIWEANEMVFRELVCNDLAADCSALGEGKGEEVTFSMKLPVL